MQWLRKYVKRDVEQVIQQEMQRLCTATGLQEPRLATTNPSRASKDSGYASFGVQHTNEGKIVPTRELNLGAIVDSQFEDDMEDDAMTQFSQVSSLWHHPATKSNISGFAKEMTGFTSRSFAAEVAEVAEQLAWVKATLRSSPHPQLPAPSSTKFFNFEIGGAEASGNSNILVSCDILYNLSGF
ncbi:hypothetical protein PspLS_01642, partial [Pyricularia sp. CBS 133598]